MCPRCRREVPKGLSDTVPPIQCLKCFFGIRGGRSSGCGCGYMWMKVDGTTWWFQIFFVLGNFEPPLFFFGFHDPPIWGAYFFSKWVGWLGSNYQLDVDLFARFLTNSNSAGLNVTFSIGSGFESPGRCIIGWTMDETYVSLCESWIFDIQILWTFLGVWCVLQRFCFEHVASKIFPSQTTTWENPIENRVFPTSAFLLRRKHGK